MSAHWLSRTTMHHLIRNDVRRTRYWVWLMFYVVVACRDTPVFAYECDVNATRLQTGKCQCSDEQCDASPRAHRRPGVKCAPCQTFTPPDDEDEYPRVCGFAVQFRGRSGLSKSSEEDFMIMQDATGPSIAMESGEPMVSASSCRDYCVAKLGKSCTFFHWRGGESTAPCLRGGTCFIPKIDSISRDPFATGATNATSSSILFVRRREIELPGFDLLRTDAHTSTNRCAFNNSIEDIKNANSAKATSLRDCASACVDFGPECTNIGWIGVTSAVDKSAHGFNCVLNPGKLACEFPVAVSETEMEPVTTIVTSARQYSMPGYWAPQQGLVCTGGNTLPGNDSETHLRVEDIERCANLCNGALSKCEAFVWISEIISEGFLGEMLSSPGSCIMKKSSACKGLNVTSVIPSALFYTKS